jgi:hypothetical protein
MSRSKIDALSPPQQDQTQGVDISPGPLKPDELMMRQDQGGREEEVRSGLGLHQLRKKGEKSAVPQVSNKKLHSSQGLETGETKEKKKGTSDALKIDYLSSKIISKVANQEVMMMMMMIMMMMITTSMMTTNNNNDNNNDKPSPLARFVYHKLMFFLSVEERVPPYGRNSGKDEESNDLCWS